MSRYLNISGNLLIEKFIGKGSFSAVYQAQNLKTKHKFALKKICIGEIEDEKARNDCMKEVYLLQNLNHPNIIKYLGSEFDEVNGILNVFLELASYGDLLLFIRDHIRKICLIPEETIWRFIVQLSSALKFMHSNKIMHRDLKPANILLTADGNIKICDFGFAKYFVDDSKLYAISPLGSPYYMSPERLLQRKYNFKSDIWSLGCVIYEMAALQSPFYVNKLDINLLIKRVTRGDYPPLPSDVYSEGLRFIIGICLKIDYKQRPSAHEILDFANNFCAERKI